jgi:tetratricopeptide (TPR) repeat protein
MKAIGSTLAIVMLLAGVSLIAYARWTRVIAQADTALTARDLDQALSAYERASARFDATPAARQLFGGEYNRIAENRLWILYRMKRYDDAIEAAEHAPLDSAPHFWAGCAFFEKARVEQNPETRLGWLARAEEELRKAVEASPDDWDTKFDYELTARLVTELRKQPKTPPAQMMQLLRPPTPGAKTPRRVG